MQTPCNQMSREAILLCSREAPSFFHDTTVYFLSDRQTSRSPVHYSIFVFGLFSLSLFDGAHRQRNSMFCCGGVVMFLPYSESGGLLLLGICECVVR